MTNFLKGLMVHPPKNCFQSFDTFKCLHRGKKEANHVFDWLPRGFELNYFTCRTDLFCCLKIINNTLKTNAKCLSYTSYALWLLSTFFHTSYQMLIDNKTKSTTSYIHYKGFFEMTTLVVILLQNIYYGDKQTRQKEQIEKVLQVNNELFAQEMKTQPKTRTIFQLNKDASTSNSAYFYFKDVDNIIDENTISRGDTNLVNNNPTEAINDEDDIDIFDKDHLTSKVMGSQSMTSSFLNLFKSKTPVDYNDELQQKQDDHQSMPKNQTQSTTIRPKKTGILFAYTNNKLWKLVLCIFSLAYYIYALVVLINVVGRTPFTLFVCPFLHSVVISIAWLYKRYFKK